MNHMSNYQSYGSRKPNTHKSNKGVIAASILLGILLALCLAAFLFFRSYYGLSNYISDSKAAETVKHVSAAELGSNGLSEEQEAVIYDSINTARQTAVLQDKKLLPILLIGVDRRDDSWNGNADSIILLTINKSDKTVHMTSFMRDLCADIEDCGIRKLNSACAIGGPTLLVSTLEDNYRVGIKNYACVDYVSMAAIIDLLGTIPIDVNSEEAELANGLIYDMCNTQGISPEGHLFSNGAGTYDADGLMTVGYARIRFTGNADYERTERQRTVLTRIMDRVKDMDSSELNTFIRSALPYVTHNIDTLSMLGLMAQIPSLTNYQAVQSRVPYDGMYSVENEILVPTEPATVQTLQAELKGE